MSARVTFSMNFEPLKSLKLMRTLKNSEWIIAPGGFFHPCTKIQDRQNTNATEMISRGETQ